VPAPDDVVEPHDAKVEAVRAGRKFKPMQQLLWVLDVLPLASGGLRVCCIVHLSPEVSYLVPSSVVRAALMHAPCCGVVFLDMARNIRLPNPLKLQALDVEEDLVDVTVAGTRVAVSKVLASVLADPPFSPTEAPDLPLAESGGASDPASSPADSFGVQARGEGNVANAANGTAVPSSSSGSPEAAVKA